MHRIEVTGRLIRENKGLVTNHRTSYGNALLLAAGQLARHMAGAMCYAHAIHYVRHAALALGGWHVVIQQCELDVLGNVKLVDQVEALER